VRLARQLLLALWVGVLVAVGGLLAPALFAALSDRSLAGRIAAEMFRRTTFLSLALALALVVLGAASAAPRRRLGLLGPLIPALLLLLSEYAVRPMLELARAADGAGGRTFVLWHSLSAALFAAATLAAAWLLLAELRRAP
jgi:hypothetical protein